MGYTHSFVNPITALYRVIVLSNGQYPDNPDDPYWIAVVQVHERHVMSYHQPVLELEDILVVRLG